MSVVNQVLRDLQSRSESKNQLPLQAVKLESKNKKLVILLISVLFLLGFWLAFNQKDKQSENNSQKEQQPVLVTNENLENNDKITSSSNKNSDVNEIKIVDSDREVSKELDKVNLAVKTNKSQKKSIEDKKTDGFSSNKIPQREPLILEKELTKNSVEKKEKIIVAKSKSTKQIKIDNPQSVKTQSLSSSLEYQLIEIKNNLSLVGVTQTINLLDKLLDKHNDFHQARLFLMTLEWKNYSKNVAERINQAVDKFPSQSAYRLFAARYYLQNEQLEKSESYLLNLNITGEGYNEVLHMRAIIRQKLNKHQLAIEDYTLLIRKFPERGDYYIALGISLESLNRNEQALMSYQSALKDNHLSKLQKQFLREKIQFYQG